MKKQILIVCLVFVSLRMAAEKPPATYQQFRTEFMNMELSNNYIFELDQTTSTWIAAGTGMGIVGVSGYFLVNGQMSKFQNAVLIGGAAYIPILAILILSEDSGSRFPYY